MKVQMEMGPKEFTLSTQVNGFVVGEDVDIDVNDDLTLRGRIEGKKPAVYGRDQTPCTRLKIALTSKNIARQHGQYLRGATITGRRSGAGGEIYDRDPNKYTQPMVKQDYVAGIVLEIQTLLERASRNKDDNKAKQWFGADLGSVQLQRIHHQATTMLEGYNAIATTHFVCTTGIYLAAADMDNREQYKPTRCQILLGKGFTFERYSWGEKVCTLAHELSHWFLNTVDAKYQGEDAYGLKAFDMAVDDDPKERRKCLTNAENWGFYLCSYRSEGDGNDWRNMTRNELALREPFDAGAQRVNAAVVNLI